MATWRDALRDSVAGISNFAEHCRELATGTEGWTHADSPELIGLERWGTALAAGDVMAGIGALVTAAQLGFPDIVAAGSDMLADMGMTGDEGEPILDGAAQEVQIGRAAAWLDDPKGGLAKVTEGFDRTRQLYVWDDDLLPQEDAPFFWYLDAGQCCSAAILNRKKKDRDDDGDGYYEWSSEACVGRGLVVVARGLRGPGADIGAILERLRVAFASV